MTSGPSLRICGSCRSWIEIAPISRCARRPRRRARAVARGRPARRHRPHALGQDRTGRAHHLAHAVRAHDQLAAAVELDAAPTQRLGVDRVALEGPAHQRGQRHREHHGQHDPVVAGQLDHQQQGRDRGVRGRGEGAAHADQRVGAGARGERGRELVQARAEQPTRDRAEVERGLEHAARSARGQREAGGHELGGQQHREPGPWDPAQQRVAHGRVAHAVQVRDREDQAAQHQSAAGGTPERGTGERARPGARTRACCG